uniref:uncharacterized protein n=1 Tax=Myxine glutinosa TaxID=7769 RepID=UPI0035901E7B
MGLVDEASSAVSQGFVKSIKKIFPSNIIPGLHYFSHSPLSFTQCTASPKSSTQDHFPLLPSSFLRSLQSPSAQAKQASTVESADSYLRNCVRNPTLLSPLHAPRPPLSSLSTNPSLTLHNFLLRRAFQQLVQRAIRPRLASTVTLSVVLRVDICTNLHLNFHPQTLYLIHSTRVRTLAAQNVIARVSTTSLRTSYVIFCDVNFFTIPARTTLNRYVC